MKLFLFFIFLTGFLAFSNLTLAQNPGDSSQFKNIEMYNSSYCNFGALALVNYYTDCSTLSGDSSIVRGIRHEGRCLATENYLVETACTLYKAASSKNSVLFFMNNYCSSNVVAAVAEKYKCEEIAGIIGGSSRIGSVWLNGHCVQIANSEFTVACNRFIP